MLSLVLSTLPLFVVSLTMNVRKTATGIDATHTNLYGAKMNAYYIANAVKSSKLALAANIKTNIAQ